MTVILLQANVYIVLWLCIMAWFYAPPKEREMNTWVVFGVLMSASIMFWTIAAIFLKIKGAI